MGRAFISRSVVGRVASGALLLLAVMSVPVATQVPGQNVNMISVDKYLQKQNEVDVTISPRNPATSSAWRTTTARSTTRT